MRLAPVAIRYWQDQDALKRVAAMQTRTTHGAAEAERLPKVATEMALHVLAYNLTRVMNIIGVQPLLALMRA
jgi:hypothetical protein